MAFKKNGQAGSAKSRKWQLLPVAGFLFLSLLGGCASSSKTTTIQQIPVSSPPAQVIVVEKQTTKVESEPRGVMGSIFHVTGEIIAFPFELIAGVFRAIF